MVLTNENQKLVCEFENIIDEDEKLKQQLGRKDKIVQILRNNKNNIEQSLSSLEGHINNNNQNMNMNIIHNHNKVKNKIYHQKQKFRAISPANNIRPYSSNNSPNTYNRSQLSYSDEY